MSGQAMKPASAPTPAARWWPAEVALWATSVMMAITSARLFSSSEYVVRLLLVLTAAHATAVLMRRRGVPLSVSTPALMVIGTVFICWVYLPTTLVAGIIPTADTIQVGAREVTSALSVFQRRVAPVPLRLGFEIIMAFAAWMLALLSDAAAFTSSTPTQAVAPQVAAFVGTSVLARGTQDLAASFAFSATVAAYVGLHRASSVSGLRWAHRQRSRGVWSLSFGSGVTAVLVAALAVGGAQLSGLDRAEPLVDMAELGRGPGPLRVDNPLVGIGNLLGNQSDEVMFTVRSTEAHYWRLTSLEDFDSRTQLWKTNERYQSAETGEPLELAAPTGTSRRDVDVRIAQLPGLWLPTPYQPIEVDADLDIRYSPNAQAVIASGQDSIAGVRYSVRAATGSEVTAQPAVRRSVLQQAQTQPTVNSDLLDRLVGRALRYGSQPLTVLRTLQDELRSYTYDTRADYSRSANPTESFLAAKRGFCQQFAGVFAIAARRLGLPSRVAVGFTYGRQVAGPDRQGRMTYEVRGRQAHAWPEVYLDGLGWVAFEPTPARGNPDSQETTGVSPAQDSTPPAASTTPTTQPASGPTGQSADATGRTDRWTYRLILAAVAALALGSALVIGRLLQQNWRRHRRRGPQHTPAGLIRAAWVDAVDQLRLLGVEPTADLTPHEVAELVGARVPDLREPLINLADLETRRRFSPSAPDGDDVTAAASAAERVERYASDATTRLERIRHSLDW